MTQHITNLSPDRQTLALLYETPSWVTGVSGQLLITNRGGELREDLVSVALTTGAVPIEEDYIAFETPIPYSDVMQLQNINLSPGQQIYVWCFDAQCTFTFTCAVY